MTLRTSFNQTEPSPTRTSTTASSTMPSSTTFAPSTDEAGTGTTSDATQHLLADRRGVLAAAVVAVGAGALAACSSPPVASETPSSSSTATATTTSADPTGTSTQAPTSDATPAPGGTPTSEIPVGGGMVFSDQQIVVTQPSAGQFKAFSAVCTHQGCLVGQVEGGQIICPCHASHFDIATGAPTPESEAKTPLEAKSITVTGDTFTVS